MTIHTFTIDCAKVHAYEHTPEAASRFIARMLEAGEPVLAGTIQIGQVRKVLVDGPYVRIYVELDDRIEHGTYEGGI